MRHRWLWVGLLLPFAWMLVSCRPGAAEPYASFETRCSQLPAPRFEVVEVPVTFTEDYSHTIDQLTVKNGDNPDLQMTFGLTTGNFSHDTEFELKSVDDRTGGRTCGSPNVHVKLSMQPVVLYVAKEVAEASCPRGATYGHEMKHVAVFRQTLDDATRELKADLPATIGTGLQRAMGQAELEQEFKSKVTAYMSGFIKRWHATLTARHDAVDSTHEYSAVRQSCPN